MGCPGHTVQLVQVIGHYPQIDKPAVKFGQRLGVVVDAPQEYGLGQQRHSRPDQPTQCRRHGRIDFGRMIHMDHHDGRKPGAA